VFSINAVRYNGKVYPHLDKLRDVVKGLPSVEKVVVQSYVGGVSDEELASIPKRYVG
jgi:acetoacetyl-CoA synthetase